MPVAAKPSTLIRTTIIGVMSAGALLLLAFGPRADDQYPDGFVIVDYWEKWTGVEEAGMRQAVNDFNASVGREKRIFVRYLSTSAIEQKTLVAIAGGIPPDIAGLYNQSLPQFAELDALEPLEEFATARGITADTYKKVFWDACHYEGRLYGLVSTAFDLALFYNQQLLRERGDELRALNLDPDRPPRTIAELDEYAKVLDVKDSFGGLDSAGYIPLEPDWFKDYICIWFGGSWWDEKNKKFTFTDPGVVRAYTWMQSYPKRLGPRAMAEFRSGLGNYYSPQNAFLAGKLAMVQHGTFLANVIHHQKPSMHGIWAAAAFPSFDPKLANATYCNADVLVIPRGAKHKREAFEFIAYLHRQEVMETLANSHCKISPLAQVSDQFLIHHANPYIRVFDELAASPNARSSEPVPILPEVAAEMNTFVYRLALLEVTPERGLREMQDRLQPKYDAFMEKQRSRRKNLDQ